MLVGAKQYLSIPKMAPSPLPTLRAALIKSYFLILALFLDFDSLLTEILHLRPLALLFLLS